MKREKPDKLPPTPRQRLTMKLRKEIGTSGEGKTEYRDYIVHHTKGRFILTSKFTGLQTKVPTLGEAVEFIDRNRPG